MERRLAALVCADVAGYSRMMGADEEGTHATFKAHRTAIYPIILNHGGRLVKNTGDGFLLEFPSIVGAIQAALAIQALMAERNNHIPADRVMQFRLGVHMGDVMADEEELFGDDVNIAVRLESVAAPGGVAISAKAHGEAGKHLGVSFVDAGNHRFKNIEQQVHVWTWEPAGSDVRGREPSEASTGASNLAAQYRTAIVGVLPFANLSDSTDEYFSDGLTEDLIHALSLQSFYRVLSRNSTFSFKGKNVSTRLIAREIDATYLIQGSVRRAGTKIRVTTELIAPESGEQLWNGRYDRDIGDLFAMEGHYDAAMDASKRAVGLNPYDMGARGVLGMCHFVSGEHRQAIELFSMAAQRGNTDPRYQFAATNAFSHYLLRQYDASLSWAREALYSNPNHLQVLTLRAAALAQLGRSEEAATAAEVLLTNYPGLTVERYLRNFHWKNPADIAHYREGLLKAGVPSTRLTLVETTKRTANS